jgi:uncharacterized coiled-coil DUF342 family protein
MSDRKNVEDILSELGKRIDQLVEEARDASGRLTEETKKRIEELRERKEELENDFKEYSSGGNDRWEKAKIHLNEAADSLRKAIETFFSKS